MASLGSSIDNVPMHRTEHRGLTVEGYSRAAVQTGFRVLPIGVCLDMGACPWAFVATPRLLLTHAHLDHAAAVPAYVARRSMLKMSPPDIYLPAADAGAFQSMLRSWEVLDRGRQACRVMGVEPGRRYALSTRYGFRVVDVPHPVPAVAYILYERRHKLRSKFQGLPGPRIAELRREGAEVTETIDVPLVAYLGDTGPEGLDADPDLLGSQVVITEMTFVQPDPSDERLERIHEFGHMHVNDLLDRIDRLTCERLILTHFTTRCTPGEVHRHLEQALPREWLQRTLIWT